MGTAGALCIRHDLPADGPFPRGRPFLLQAATLATAEPLLLETRLPVAVGVDARL